MSIENTIVSYEHHGVEMHVTLLGMHGLEYRLQHRGLDDAGCRYVSSVQFRFLMTAGIHSPVFREGAAS
jgi:glutamine phosphoribosylpyrophosphate amidotransferase